MIKLKDLLELNDMTYNDGPNDKHLGRINRVVTMFENVLLEKKRFPENSSKETLEELKYLASLEPNEKFAKDHDDISDRFKELHKELELEFNKSEVKDLLRQSAKYIFELKYKYQRPRPYQIAEFYGIDLNGTKLDSMKTPSYPSGHAVQGYLLGDYYAKKYPEHSKRFVEVGEDIAHSRLIAKAHFPSDKRFGRIIADKLLDSLK